MRSSGWRCSADQYDDGAICHCSCGAFDPDCDAQCSLPMDPECDPTPLPVEGQAHHPQLAAAHDGTLVIAWDEVLEGRRRIVTARVASVRRVDWQDFRAGGFMFVFRPGTFDNAPHTFISAMKGDARPEQRGALQASLVARFPNVSVIDLREVLDIIRGVINNVTLAVTVVGALVLLSGALILVGAVSMTKFRRVYEAAILKTLGASSRLIAAMLVLEYGVLASEINPFDPMERAIVQLGDHHLPERRARHASWSLVKEYPLTPQLLAHTHVWDAGAEDHAWTRDAPSCRYCRRWRKLRRRLDSGHRCAGRIHRHVPGSRDAPAQ